MSTFSLSSHANPLFFKSRLQPTQYADNLLLHTLTGPQDNTTGRIEKADQVNVPVCQTMEDF